MLPKGLLKEYSSTLALMIRMIDVVIVYAAGFLAGYVRFDAWHLPPDYLLAMLAGVTVAPLVFSSFHLYSSVRGKGMVSHFFTLVESVAVFALILAGIAYLTKTGELYSRMWFASWMLTSLFALVTYRLVIILALRFMRTRGMNERVVVIFGAGKLGKQFAESVQQALWTGFRIAAFIDDHASDKPEMISGIPVLQTPDNLAAYLKDNTVDEIWLALPLRAEKRVKEILYLLRHETITTRFVLDIFGLDLLNHSISELAGFPVLNVSATPMVGANRLLKAFEDRMLAFIILLIISPFFFLIALMVKLTSKGPVFFKQERLGWDGRVIKVYKFRTMYMHQEDGGKVTQATQADPRITPIGKWLRRSSLDELPQFFNVLQGRMSIVGPRPHALAHNEQYKELIHTYMQRHRVKPGITGWAQVNGWRGETDTLEKMQKRVEYDLYYINNWSLTFDFKIIMLTFLRGFVGKNAY